ncbi:hypothetical protein J3R30DRAFT_3707330 [Lentinula aciculospora]|uniref:Uncharacterized protein n=1 Tax=Lentinula aciculospora TaxID=153920 RepID=A0A9W9DK73_9AGAR|nr:hypothetical protein J3R30DRAFT_3707330 [Lentinula aciculospora]
MHFQYFVLGIAIALSLAANGAPAIDPIYARGNALGPSHSYDARDSSGSRSSFAELYRRKLTKSQKNRRKKVAEQRLAEQRLAEQRLAKQRLTSAAKSPPPPPPPLASTVTSSAGAHHSPTAQEQKEFPLPSPTGPTGEHSVVPNTATSHPPGALSGPAKEVEKQESPGTGPKAEVKPGEAAHTGTTEHNALPKPKVGEEEGKEHHTPVNLTHAGTPTPIQEHAVASSTAEEARTDTMYPNEPVVERPQNGKTDVLISTLNTLTAGANAVAALGGSTAGMAGGSMAGPMAGGSMADGLGGNSMSAVRCPPSDPNKVLISLRIAT